MTLIRFAQRSSILVNALPSNLFLFPLITLVISTGLGSISGCTDKATELQARKCTNIKNLMEEKNKSIQGSKDLYRIGMLNGEVDKLQDEF